jgi:16S rRNA (cytosine1402-N4)-methyltransferase
MTTEYQHISVLKQEILDLLDPQPGQHFVDCTLGGGGHTESILGKTAPSGKVLAFELDDRAITASKEKLKIYQNRLIIAHKSYVHLKQELTKHKKDIKKLSGILLDLGLSSDQLDKANRGFSFKDHGSLDMRFDKKGQVLTASDIILTWPEDKLVKIFREYGEVKQPKRLAKGIILWRQTLVKQKQKILKTSMLVYVILRILNIKPDSVRRFRKHPATQIFQSLRIAVNSELDNLKSVLPQAIEVLPTGGRLAVISFHSLEDRMVKRYFKELTRGCICPPENPVCSCDNEPQIKLINKRAIKPSKVEIEGNPRSRSAILRVIEKL